MPTMMLAWVVGYLVLGLLVSAAGYSLLSHENKLAIMEFETREDRDEAPWCFCRPPEKLPPFSLWKFLLFAAVVLPALIWFAAKTLLQCLQSKRQVAWQRSPAGQAEAERRYRQMLENEIAPWVPWEWITKRDLPRAEFEADYQDSKHWAPLSRDAFELLWRRVSEQDEIGYFSTPPETWQDLYGRAGWVVIREGKIIGQLIIVMN